MKRFLVPAVVGLAVGCTAHPEPIVDTKGVNDGGAAGGVNDPKNFLLPGLAGC
jgi:hypothetical protein